RRRALPWHAARLRPARPPSDAGAVPAAGPPDTRDREAARSRGARASAARSAGAGGAARPRVERMPAVPRSCGRRSRAPFRRPRSLHPQRTGAASAIRPMTYAWPSTSSVAVGAPVLSTLSRQTLFTRPAFRGLGEAERERVLGFFRE